MSSTRDFSVRGPRRFLTSKWNTNTNQPSQPSPTNEHDQIISPIKETNQVDNQSNDQEEHIEEVNVSKKQIKPNNSSRFQPIGASDDDSNTDIKKNEILSDVVMTDLNEKDNSTPKSNHNVVEKDLSVQEKPQLNDSKLNPNESTNNLLKNNITSSMDKIKNKVDMATKQVAQTGELVDQATDSDNDLKQLETQPSTSLAHKNIEEKNGLNGSSKIFDVAVNITPTDDGTKSGDDTASVDIIEVLDSPPMPVRRSPSVPIINIDDEETASDNEVIMESPIVRRQRRRQYDGEVKFVSERNERSSRQQNRNSRSKRGVSIASNPVILESDNDIEKIDNNVPSKRKTRSASRREKQVESDDSDQGTLSRAITNADNFDVPEILEAWKTKEGRRKIRELNSNDHRRSNRKSKKSRNTKRRLRKNSEHTEDEKESDGESQTDSDASLSPRKSRTKTKRRTKNYRQPESVPLPRTSTLRDRLNRRRSLIDDFKGLEYSKSNPNSIVKTNRNQQSRSKRRSRQVDEDPIMDYDSDEILDEGQVEPNPADQDESNSETDRTESGNGSELEEEEILEDQHLSDRESEEEEENKFHSEDDDDDDDEESDEEEYIERPNTRRTRSMAKRKRGKRNLRRKRTQPRDVFEVTEKRSKREERKRLEFLVQQSAEIASFVHKAISNVTANVVPSPTKTGPIVLDAEGNEVPAAATQGQEENGDTKTDEVVPIPKIKEEEFAPPTGENRSLQPHQVDGIKWLLTLDAQGLNAILADEMGLGKTIQAISFLASLVISGSRGPHLVIAPKNVCEHWADEVRTWYPDQITVVTHLGNAEERLDELARILEEDNFDILVTSYEHALRDLFFRQKSYSLTSENTQALRKFRKIEFEYLVVDEAHRLCNDKTKLNMGIRKYKNAQRRLLLTGTPLSNKLRELWCLLNVLNPRIFSNKETFEEWFAAPFGRNDRSRNRLSRTEQSVIVDRLHTIVRPFFRRRVRADICPNFTSADEILINCPMSSLQRALVLHLTRRGRASEAGLPNIIMAMRGVSNHPYMASPCMYDVSSDDYGEKLVSSSGKFVFLYHALPKLLASGHRILIFSQFRDTLDLLEDLLNLLQIRFGRLDGMTSTADRLTGLKAFTRAGSKIQILLLTTRAGGVGLNLQAADTVILFDSDWNPSADLQAVSRIQRIGQKRTVHILRLMTEKTVENVIIDVARNKLRTQALAVSAGKFNSSFGAAQDHKMRQKQLEQVLETLETDDYLGVTEVGSAISSTSNGNSSSTQVDKIRETMLQAWDQSLLRKGETSLESVEQAPAWIDSFNGKEFSTIPLWLAPDADLIAASKALKAFSPDEAERVYKDVLLQKEETGAYSRQGRAERARRQGVVDYGDLLEDSDSNSGEKSESDASVVIEDVAMQAVSDDEVVIEPTQNSHTQDNSKGNNMPSNNHTSPQTNSNVINVDIDSPPQPVVTNSNKKRVTPSPKKQSIPSVPMRPALIAPFSRSENSSLYSKDQQMSSQIVLNQNIPSNEFGTPISKKRRVSNSVFSPSRDGKQAEKLQPVAVKHNIRVDGTSQRTKSNQRIRFREETKTSAQKGGPSNILNGVEGSAPVSTANGSPFQPMKSIMKVRGEAPTINNVNGNRQKQALTQTQIADKNQMRHVLPSAGLNSSTNPNESHLVWTQAMEREYWYLTHKIQLNTRHPLAADDFRNTSMALFNLLVIKLEIVSKETNKTRLRNALIAANGDLERAKAYLQVSSTNTVN